MLWLAFDIGTTGTKAALVEDSTGHVLRSAYRGYETHTAAGGVIEQSAADWWQAVIATTRELDAHEAEAVAITGQMQDLILIDAQGEPIRPVILYSDSRAHAEAKEINMILNSERLQKTTGNSQEAGSLL